MFYKNLVLFLYINNFIFFSSAFRNNFNKNEKLIENLHSQTKRNAQAIVTKLKLIEVFPSLNFKTFDSNLKSAKSFDILSNKDNLKYNSELNSNKHNKNAANISPLKKFIRNNYYPNLPSADDIEYRLSNLNLNSDEATEISSKDSFSPESHVPSENYLPPGVVDTTKHPSLIDSLEIINNPTMCDGVCQVSDGAMCRTDVICLENM